MIGIIITGHGEFAKGLLHASTMIGGEQAHVTSVLFENEMPLDAFQTRLRTTINTFRQKYDGVLVMTDLKGGTPFNVSALLTHEDKKIIVISGTNLPMVIEASLMSQFSESAISLAQQIIQTGKDGIDFLNLDAQTIADEPDYDVDGI